MKRRHESGFSITELLIGLFAIALLIFAGMWVYSRQSSSSKLDKVAVQEKVDDTKPVLQNLGGIYLAAYDKNTGLAGDLKFDRHLFDPSKGIETTTYIFGQKMVHTGQSDRINPSFDFRGIHKQIDVLAAIDGKVLFIKNQSGSNDYEIVLAKSDGSTWHISYDHITDLKAKRGDTVLAGQVLGKAAPYRNGTYYYEIQVTRKTSPLGDTIEYACPTTLLAPEIKAAYVEGINLVIRDWVTYRTTDAYGSQDGGCVKPVLKAKEVDV